MPGPKIDIRDRKVVMIIFVVVAGLAVLNWRVFQPMRAKHARIIAQQEEEMQNPEDLDEMVVFAASQISGTIVTEPGSRKNSAGLATRRDPFTRISDSPRLIDVPAVKAVDGMFCTAVLLGGERPVAIINGRACHEGDMISGYSVERITTREIELKKGRKQLILNIARDRNSDRYSPPVNDSGDKKHLNNKSETGRK